jgi:hypothetical protein
VPPRLRHHKEASSKENESNSPRDGFAAARVSLREEYERAGDTRREPGRQPDRGEHSSRAGHRGLVCLQGEHAPVPKVMAREKQCPVSEATGPKRRKSETEPRQQQGHLVRERRVTLSSDCAACAFSANLALLIRLSKIAQDIE